MTKIYVNGRSYHVIQAGEQLGRDGVVRDAGGREVARRAVDEKRAAAWLEDGTADPEPPVDVSPSKPKKGKKKGAK